MNVQSTRSFALAAGSCGTFDSWLCQAGGEKVAEAKIHCGGSMLVRVKPICKSAENSCKGQNLAKVMVSRLCPRLTVTPWADTKYHNVKKAGLSGFRQSFLKGISRAIDIKVSLSWFRAGLAQTALHHHLEQKPDVDWFEIITENYLAGWGNHFIIWIVSGKLSGRDARVSPSIGSTERLIDYLSRQKTGSTY